MEIERKPAVFSRLLSAISFLAVLFFLPWYLGQLRWYFRLPIGVVAFISLYRFMDFGTLAKLDNGVLKKGFTFGLSGL
jgi:hypothetical protein